MFHRWATRLPIPDRQSLEKLSTPRVLHSGVLGLIRWENQALTHDLENLLKDSKSTELLNDFLSGKGRETNQEVVVPPELDRFHVTDVDPSQERAVWLARNGPGLVVHGPPGTGKSQTIVNMVAHSLAHGQRVLVICQKRAAIDVVAARLRAHGLGDLFCVVHDSESDRTRTILGIKSQIADFNSRAIKTVQLPAYMSWKETCELERPVLRRVNVAQFEQNQRRIATALEEKRELEVAFIREPWHERQASRRKGDFNGILVTRGPNGKRLRQVVELGQAVGLFDFRPCWLTNPNTAGQIFPHAEQPFDLVRRPTPALHSQRHWRFIFEETNGKDFSSSVKSDIFRALPKNMPPLTGLQHFTGDVLQRCRVKPRFSHSTTASFRPSTDGEFDENKIKQVRAGDRGGGARDGLRHPAGKAGRQNLPPAAFVGSQSGFHSGIAVRGATVLNQACRERAKHVAGTAYV